MMNPKTTFELVGTAMFLFTIQLSVSSDFAPLAIGGILMAIIFSGFPVSGGHINPAVSTAVALRGLMPVEEMFAYMIAQIVGGILGGLLGGFVGSSFNTVAMGDDVSYVQALLAEVIVAFMLCFVVLCVATNPKIEDNHYTGLSIGLVVVAGAVAVGPISGGAFNPAVALGLSISAGFSNIGYSIMVAVANLIGGAVAAGCFRIIFPSVDEKVTTDVSETTPLNRA